MINPLQDIVNNVIQQCQAELGAMILLFGVVCGFIWLAVIGLKASV